MSKETVRLAAFTLVEVMVSIAIVGILAAGAVASILHARNRAAVSACVGNLTQISRAKIIWALENKKSGTDVPTESELFAPENYLRRKPVCPWGGIYTLNAVSNAPTCNVAKHVLPSD